MLNKNQLLMMIKEQAKAEAVAFREKVIAGKVSDENLYANIHLIPEWQEGKDYSNYPAGTIVKHNEEIYVLNSPDAQASEKDALNKNKSWKKKKHSSSRSNEE